MIDSIDQLILERLKANCRISLQELSRLTDISAHAVRKRIDSLVSSRKIERFEVILSPLMTNEDTAIAILSFQTEQEEIKILKYLSKNPSIDRVSRLLDGRYVVFGVYFDSGELSSLTMHLRKIPGIIEVELFSKFLHYWGGKIHLTSPHREILRCLLEDPRMAISDIAKETGLLSNDVKELVEQMSASEAVHFTIDESDELDERTTEVLAKVQWNVGKTSKENVLGWLQEQYSSLRLGEYVSATEPTLFFHFSVNHVQEVEIVVQKTIESGLVTTIEPLVLFPGKTFPDPRRRRAKAILEETGFSSQNGPFA